MKKAQLFVTCLVNEFYPRVGFAVAKVLDKVGWSLDVPQAQICCGQPAFNAGYLSDSRKAALAALDVFEGGVGPLLVPSGSCGDMLAHHLAGLFEEGSSEHRRALALSSRVREFSQFLVDDLGVRDLGGRLEATVAYHPSCHLLRGLGVDGQPRQLLEAVKGTRLLPLHDAEVCCGFGGSFSMTHEGLSGAMLDDKLKAVQASQAERLVSCDMGCLMHLGGGLDRRGAGPKVQHLAEYLAESLG